MTAFRAFHIPADQRAATSVYTEPLPILLRRCQIDLLEVIHTRIMADHNCVMVMDDDAVGRRLPVNRRAQFISGYPISHALRGDVLVMGETGDSYSGFDLASISQASLDSYLQNKEVHKGYDEWLRSAPVFEYSVAHGFITLPSFNPH